MRAVGGASSAFSGSLMLASESGLPSKPRVASCGSVPPTVMVPAMALYAIDWPPTVTLPSVMESGVVGVWGAADTIAAEGFSSGLSCAKLTDEAAKTAAMVRQTKGEGRQGRVWNMYFTSGGWMNPSIASDDSFTAEVSPIGGATICG